MFEELCRMVKEGKRLKAKELTQKALDAGLEPAVIMNEGLISGMSAVGELFGKGEVYLPEVIMSSRAMKESLELILPVFRETQYHYLGKVALGTVKGDIHDIGRRIVEAVFIGSGFEVMDLGVDVPAEKFAHAVEQGAQIVGMSALIGPTMQNMKLTMETLEKAGLRSKVKIIVGGAIITQEYADKIGADAYGRDAFDGVNKVRKLLSL